MDADERKFCVCVFVLWQDDTKLAGEGSGLRMFSVKDEERMEIITARPPSLVCNQQFLWSTIWDEKKNTQLHKSNHSRVEKCLRCQGPRIMVYIPKCKCCCHKKKRAKWFFWVKTNRSHVDQHRPTGCVSTARLLQSFLELWLCWRARTFQ